jgi:hypothetical protein
LQRNIFSIFWDIIQYYLTDFKKEKQSNTEIHEKYQYFEDFMETVSIFWLYPSKDRSGDAKNLDSQITLHALSFAIIKKGLKNFCMTLYYENARFSHGLSLNQTDSVLYHNICYWLILLATLLESTASAEKSFSPLSKIKIYIINRDIKNRLKRQLTQA